MQHEISSEGLTIEIVHRILLENYTLKLSDESKAKVKKCRSYLDKKVKTGTDPIYGVTTGFGSLCNTLISTEDLTKLQENLLKSHACGTGDILPTKVIKLMLLLKIQSLSYGHSGVQQETIERLMDFYNKGIYPIVYTQGSLGASGDLAPLAHLCLPLIGEGQVLYEGEIYTGKELNKKFQWKPIKLKSKESLALINGTQFMAGMGLFILLHASSLISIANLIAALSLDAFNGRMEPFLDMIHLVRPHQGQIEVANHISTILSDSQIAHQPKPQVQDPYSFRCIPQVHGASMDAMRYAVSVFETEINSVTDNPTIFPDEDRIISAGNFHGQPLALSLDFLSMALAELGSISERRIYQLIDGKHGLPPYLVANPGLNSGFMIPQYTAAALVNENKTLTMPSSTDSIPSSQGQEDHVSMGANAATKCLRVLENLKKIFAIELFTAAQALEFRRPLKSSEWIEKFVEYYRDTVPFIENDMVMYNKIDDSVNFIDTMIEMLHQDNMAE
jgi:histidine ammonia-lyase